MVRCGSRTLRQTVESSRRTDSTLGSDRQRSVSLAVVRRCHLILELDHVMAAEAVDEVGGSAFGDDLAVIDYGEAVAEAFGLVHVMRGEQDGATFFLESADDVPELAAALGIESGGGLVEKKNARIADQSGGYG